MTLTQKQIDTLFKFIESEGVAEYDLQVELVDHLACAIEDKLNVDSTLSPYTALQEVYGDFGRDGFDKLVTERTAVLREQNRENYGLMVKQYFKFPRILTTLIVFFSFYSAFQYTSPKMNSWVLLIVGSLGLVVQLIIHYNLWKDCKKKLLLIQNFNFYRLLSLVVPILFFLLKTPLIPNSFYFTAMITFIPIATMANVQLNKQLKEQAQNLYPEAFVKA